jgi:hypothetical protein
MNILDASMGLQRAYRSFLAGPEQNCLMGITLLAELRLRCAALLIATPDHNV